MTWFELISFTQCVKVLGRHEIHLVCPEGMDTSNYTQKCAGLKILRVPQQWFSSLAAYNSLKIQPFLYKAFSGFRFLLTHELDSFVFSDQLERWCDDSFDYIGAPWFDGYCQATKDAKFVGVGNSGFSLRNVAACHKITSLLYYRSRLWKAFADWRCYGRLTLGSLYLLYRQLKDPLPVLREYRGQEDVFWCQVIPSAYPQFRIAPFELAREFAFEVNAQRLYADCGNQLPFGCHKWMTYDFDFWRPYILGCGYELPSTAFDGSACKTIPRE